MNVSTAVFYLIALITVGSAAMVAFSRNIIYSAFSLLGTFMGVAGLYVFLGADFVAAVQVLIYVGGILVLILFALGLSACLWSVRYFFSTREAQSLQFRYQVLQSTMAGMQSLVAESIEYSKRNPDLDPLLYKFNLKPRATNAPAAAPRPAR